MIILLLYLIIKLFAWFPGKNKDVSDKIKNLELGEDRGAEQRFDYDSEEENENEPENEEETGLLCTLITVYYCVNF